MQSEHETLLSNCSHWSEREVNLDAFKDARLGNQFLELLRGLSDRMGGTIPLACQDWAGTKAAYRFFSNPRVEEGNILSGHFDATRTRYAATEGAVLMLQDTTEFPETLEVVPSQWKVIQTVREKFTCRACEKISQPPAPFHAIPRGWAGPHLIAMVAFDK